MHARRAGEWALAAAAVATAVVGGLLVRLHTVPDPDLWLHLRIGQVLARGGTFGLPDPLVSLADRAYSPTQWLAELLGYRVWEVAGLPGVEVLRDLGVLALGACLLFGTRSRAAAQPAAIAAMVALFGSAAGWGERPQLLGLVLFAGVYAAWLRAVDGRGLPLWVVPSTWVWAGVHGTWVTGIGLGLLVILGGVLDGRLAYRRAISLGGVLVAALLAGLMTPLGTAALTEPFRVSAALTGHVNEWQRPSAGNLLMWAVLLGAILIAFEWFRHGQWSPSRVLLLLTAVVNALFMVRLIALGAIMLAPLLAEALDGQGATRLAVRRRTQLWVWGMAAAVFLGICLPKALTPSQGPLPPSVDQAVASAAPGSTIAVDLRVSGWVLWRFPGQRPLRDLRSELYAPATAAAYDRFMSGSTGWDSYATVHAVRGILVRDASPLARLLAGRRDWQSTAHEQHWQFWVRSP